jgi:hypothetical protein
MTMSIKTQAEAANDVRELSVSELEVVTGGCGSCIRLPIIGTICVPPRLPSNPVGSVVRGVVNFFRGLF